MPPPTASAVAIVAGPGTYFTVAVLLVATVATACSGSVPRDLALRTATAVAEERGQQTAQVGTSGAIAAQTAAPDAVPLPTPTAQSPAPPATPDSGTPGPGTTPTSTPQPTSVPIIDPIGAPVTTFGLFLEVIGLGEENIVRGNTLFLSGRANPDAVLSINGVIVPVDSDGVFGVNVSLDPGPNLLEVVASDLAGNTESRVITVISLDDES